jgi:hypothetical protein
MAPVLLALRNLKKKKEDEKRTWGGGGEKTYFMGRVEDISGFEGLQAVSFSRGTFWGKVKL